MYKKTPTFCLLTQHVQHLYLKMTKFTKGITKQLLISKMILQTHIYTTTKIKERQCHSHEKAFPDFLLMTQISKGNTRHLNASVVASISDAVRRAF